MIRHNKPQVFCYALSQGAPCAAPAEPCAKSGHSAGMARIRCAWNTPTLHLGEHLKASKYLHQLGKPCVFLIMMKGMESASFEILERCFFWANGMVTQPGACDASSKS